MNCREIEALGEADLQIAGLRIWVHGRQFPDAMDYWDGNWLRVTAYCIYPDSMVRAHGSIIHLGELVGLLDGCARMNEALAGEAVLECIEPNLGAKLKMQWNGSISVRLDITQDQMTENHSFEDSIDQSYLLGLIGQCLGILMEYPLREPSARQSASDA